MLSRVFKIPLAAERPNSISDEKAAQGKNVIIVGGGPGGMKAAVTASDRGHNVTLIESAKKLGGQVNLAEKLPGRAEFGGVTTNLQREIHTRNISIHLDSEISNSWIKELRPDDIIVATGSTPRLPSIESLAESDDTNIINSWSVIEGEYVPGHNVVIADWACDWGGLGLAHKLAMDGHHVQLFCGGSVPGESLQGIVRDQWIGELHKLNVVMTPFARLYGTDQNIAYFQHMLSGEPIICEDVDTIVSCYAPKANNQFPWLSDIDCNVHFVGDAISPRTVEEAVLEGFTIAWNL